MLVLLCVSTSSAKPRGHHRRPSALKALSAAHVLATIDLQDFGSHVVRYGRLGDASSVGAVLVQIGNRREVTCLTAVSLIDGRVLWQQGKPSRRNFRTTGDIPVQLYDWNGDGIDDLLYFDSDSIVVLNGANGSEIARAPAEEPYSLYILQTQQFGGSAGLVLHGRTFNSLLSPELKLVWRTSNGFSHFPMSVDIDVDGEPELLAGYQLLNSKGHTLWNRRQLGIHNDAAAHGDVDCNGTPEIAVATSGKAALLSGAGDILWRGHENHAQHITMGIFDSRSCEKQIATMDRDKEQRGILRMYNSRGKLLWKSSGHGKRAMLSKVDSWIAESPASLLLVSRSFSAPPTLYDGSGNLVARLPFPPALERRDGTNTYSLHFTQHFDINEDGREEILVSNEKAIWIYANGVAIAGLHSDKATQELPNPRIYNSTFYTGMQ